jgi:hypothetical protein
MQFRLDGPSYPDHATLLKKVMDKEATQMSMVTSFVGNNYLVLVDELLLHPLIESVLPLSDTPDVPKGETSPHTGGS